MKRVQLAGLNSETSCLGFGCASLGSRVSERIGRNALARSYDAGVRWFDVAPSYGAGAAEPILGDVLKGRRDHVQICTKVGLVPPLDSAMRKALRALARPVIGAAGPLRAMIRKSGATANRAVPLTPELLRTSLDSSLTRLGTDRVDVYALHNARPEDLARDDILRALEDLLAAGKTRAVAVAGRADAAAAALAQGAPFALVQFAQPGMGAIVDPQDTPGPGLFAAAEATGMGCVTHSVFGVSGSLATLCGRLTDDAALRTRLAEAGFDGPVEAVAAALLFARARACNPHGVVLASMFSDRSLTLNLAEANQPIRPDAARICAEIGI